MNPAIFTQVINSYLPEPHASLLNGIIFGVDLKAGKEFYQEIKALGLLHIVVLSGMNITILASIIMTSSKNFSKFMSCLLTILTIIIFIIFVGFQAPVVRAGFTAILTFVAIIYGKKNYPFYSLFLSGLFILIIWPSWIRTVSFQLSYAATAGILLFGPRSQSRNQNILAIIFQEIKNEFRLSLAAQIFTAPIIFLYFKQVSLISPLSNVLVAPLIAPLMIFGFMTALLGKINYFLGLIPSYICFGLLEYLVFLIRTVSKLPLIYFKF